MDAEKGEVRGHKMRVGRFRCARLCTWALKVHVGVHAVASTSPGPAAIRAMTVMKGEACADQRRGLTTKTHESRLHSL